MLTREELIQAQKGVAEATPTDDPAVRAERMANIREIRALEMARALRFWLWVGPLLAMLLWAVLNGIAAPVIAANTR